VESVDELITRRMGGVHLRGKRSKINAGVEWCKSIFSGVDGGRGGGGFKVYRESNRITESPRSPTSRVIADIG
jgi:hypothetical protein